jgi:hypothetical protein
VVRPGRHIYLQVGEACAVGVLDAAARPVTVGWLVRQAAGYVYSYGDIIVCPTVAECTAAVSLGDHERITSVSIKDQVVTVVYRAETPAGSAATERSANYRWDGMRLRQAGP